ncbi:hypothetical protein EDD36DRAFT_269432 [Exophiala viscosa]|uniref:Uncharacterized protein n=1 Tax=Exophiala viscosa TaxID=2486360 RepID=A0AAN6IBM6_9EURO|nr:hypothetical protein EDD36DRAFT_269432 [Exophiala viscosa]
MAFLTRITAQASVEVEKETSDAFAKEARRLMEVHSNIFDDLHRAEMSGPSSNPDLQLMGMPKEIRMAILRHLLLEEGAIDMGFSSIGGRADAPYSYAAVPRYRPKPPDPWAPGSHQSTKGGPRHVTNILCINKRTLQEATEVLYGTNLFRLFKESAFKWSRKKDNYYGIGAANAAKVKFACFEYPINNFSDVEASNRLSLVLQPTNPDTEFENYFDSTTLHGTLCERLVNLQKVTLTTRVVRDRPKSRADGAAVERAHMYHIRPFFLVAARLTKFHPTLRKAVWRRWSGSRLTTHDTYDFDPAGDEISGKDPGNIIGEFHIDIVPEGLAAISNGSVSKKNARCEDIESEDMVINTTLVRQTAWRDIEAWSNIHRFALSRTATSSEVDPKQVSKASMWPVGHYENRYDPQSEVDPVSATAGEKYRKTHSFLFW